MHARPISSSATRCRSSVPRELDPGPADRGDRREARRDRTLHVDGAAPDEPPLVDLGRERRMPPGRRIAGRDDVEVAVPGEPRARPSPIASHDARAARVGPDDPGAGAEVLQDRRRDRGGLVLGPAGVLARRSR